MAIEPNSKRAELALGPMQFHWPAEIWRDFYFRIADEAPVDRVYLGEVVCGKRVPATEVYRAEVAERLRAGGKEVILSTLALVMNKADRELVRKTAVESEQLIEVNDLAAVTHLGGRPFVVGPMVNCYNEETLGYFARKGAKRVCLPVELPLTALSSLANSAKTEGVELELFAFGRMPLAVSARCYHARAHKLSKDSCRFICGADADGLTLQTLDSEDFLTVNGIETMSYTYQNLMGELGRLCENGIDAFRLSPHSCDMVEVAKLFRATLDGELMPADAVASVQELMPEAKFSNGYLAGDAGTRWHPVGAQPMV